MSLSHRLSGSVPQSKTQGMEPIFDKKKQSNQQTLRDKKVLLTETVEGWQTTGGSSF